MDIKETCCEDKRWKALVQWRALILAVLGLRLPHSQGQLIALVRKFVNVSWS